MEVGMRKYIASIILLIILAGNVCGYYFSGELTKNNLKQLEGKSFVLRKIINNSTLFHLDPPNDTSMVFAKLVTNKLFIFRKDRQFSIKKTDCDNSGSLIKFKIKLAQFGEFDIHFISPKGDKITKNDFNNLFNRLITTTNDSNSYDYYAYDQQNKLIHIRGSNHLNGLVKYTNNINELLNDNFKKCESCFSKYINIPNLNDEIMLKGLINSSYRHHNPIIVIDSVQEKVKYFGQKVLDNWPMPLKGFDYNFYAVQKNELNATAIPGGTIYISSGLLELIQDTLELEAILAHEITHIEQRHAYSTLTKARKKDFWRGFSAIGAGVAAGVITNDKKVLVGTTIALKVIKKVMVGNTIPVKVISDVTSTVSLDGYNKEQEFESDDVTQLYLNNMYGSNEKTAIQNILKKMKYLSNRSEEDFSSAYDDSHTKTIARYIHLNNSSFLPFDPPLKFIGHDKEDNIIGEIELLYYVNEKFKKKYKKHGYSYYQNKITFKHYIYAQISSTEYFLDMQKIRDFTIAIGNVKYKFDNKEDTPILPLSTTGCLFEYESSSNINFNNDILYFSLNLYPFKVERWSVVRNIK